MDLLESLNWRYAAKKMDPARPASEESVKRIIEAVRLAPTSSGLQPFDLIVVRSAELREKMKPIAFGQGQITDGSHVLVFAAWDDYTPERINMMFDLTNEQRGMKNEGWENYRNFLLNAYPPRGAEANFQHAARQSYIGLGVALVAAAVEGIDSTPMEGFDPASVDELLGLKARGLRSVSLLVLGHREADKDWLVGLKKVRRPASDFVISFD
jgi:nitroreductase